MIEVIGGKLFQWDTRRVAKVIPSNDVTIHEVHFSAYGMKYAYVVETYEKDGAVLCAIPNAILQQDKRILCYEVTRTETGEVSVSSTRLSLASRSKPQDYVYTEDELKNYDRLESLTEEKLAALKREFSSTVGDLENLNTADKSNLVAAINEAAQSGVVAQSDLSENNENVPEYVKGVLQKRHLPIGYPYSDVHSIQFNGATDGLDSVGIYYRVSDLTPSLSDLQDSGVIRYFSITDGTLSYSVKHQTITIGTDVYGCEYFYVASKDGGSLSDVGVFPRSGIYFNCNMPFYTESLSWGSAEPIDTQLLPANVPVIQSGAIGLPVVVSAVDDKGTPTKYKVDDVLKLKSLHVISSSTAGDFEHDETEIAKLVDIAANRKLCWLTNFTTAFTLTENNPLKLILCSCYELSLTTDGKFLLKIYGKDDKLFKAAYISEDQKNKIISGAIDMDSM